MKEIFSFVRDIPVTLNRDIEHLVENYANQMIKPGQSVEYYIKMRRLENVRIGYENQYLGKKGEFVGFQFLQDEYDYPYAEPDLEVRKGRKKGWYPDGYDNKHIKTCDHHTTDSVHDYSWTFTKKDKLFKETSEQILILIHMYDHLVQTGKIKCVVRLDEVRHLFKPPKKNRYKTDKKCLYYEDLKELFND